MKVRKRKQLVINPFVSEAQRRACHAADDPDWDCEEWESHTHGKLPERKPTRNSILFRNRKAAKRKLTANKSKSRTASFRPNKIDPTRTITLRRWMATELRKRFATLKGKVYQLVVVEDAFGLDNTSSLLSINTFDPEQDRDEHGRWTSKVSDESGNPLEVYHGTFADFAEFAHSNDIGFHFGTKAQAEYRIRGSGSNKRMLIATLDIKNPIEMPDHVWDTPTTLVDYFSKHGLKTDEIQKHEEAYREAIKDLKDPAIEELPVPEYRARKKEITKERDTAKSNAMIAARKTLQAAGYDGVKYKNEIEGEGYSWIAFEPSQIKIHKSIAVNVFDPDQPRDEHGRFVRWVQDLPSGETVGLMWGAHHDFSKLTPEEFREQDKLRLGMRAPPQGVDLSGGTFAFKSKEAEEKNKRLIDLLGKSAKGKARREELDPAKHTVHWEDETQVFVRPKIISNTFDPDQPRDEHGRFTKGLAAAKKAIEVYKQHYDKVTSKPVLKQIRKAGDYVKGITAKLYKGLESRYGRRQAIAIMTSAQVLSWGAMGVGMAVGVPLYLPGSSIWGSLPAAAVAETYLQARRGMKYLKGRLATNIGSLSQAHIESEAREFIDQIERHYLSYLQVYPPLNDTQLTENARWQFTSDAKKIEAFQNWLRSQVKDNLTSVSDEELWHRCIEAGFRKGAGRSYDDVKKKAKGTQKLDFYTETRDDFLQNSFAQPVTREKVELLAGRAFDDLENVTDDMSIRMSRSLTDGLVQGKSPIDIAKDMNDDVDLGKDRSILIARTEIVRAHAEGQLTALEQLGVEEVGVAVEWNSTGDDKVCPLCQPLQGIVLTVEEAHGLLPRHPNCFVNPDTPVATDLGWKPLKAVRVGDEVLTHLARFRKVTQVHRNQSKMGEVVLSLYLTGRDYYMPLEVTASHPVYSNKEWKPVGELKVGDTVTMIYAKTPDDPDPYREMKVVEIQRRCVYGDTLYNLSVEEDESFVTGFYLGQGLARSQGGYIVHNCRCAFTPANVGEDESDQKRTKGDIDKAIEDSVIAETKPHENLGKRKRAKAALKESTWAGADADISPERPAQIDLTGNELLDQFDSLLGNVFCATGQGGGIDPSCSPSSGSVTAPNASSWWGEMRLGDRKALLPGKAYMKPYVKLSDKEKAKVEEGYNKAKAVGTGEHVKSSATVGTPQLSHPSESRSATPPVPAASTPLSTPPKEHTDKVLGAFKPSDYNLLSLSRLRERTGLSIPDMHNAIRHLMRQNIVTVAGAEGRQKLSEEEKAALMPMGEGEHKVGYISLRNA